MLLRIQLIALLLFFTAGVQAQVRPFTFIHFSDTHIGGTYNSIRLQQALQDVEKNYPEAAFIIVTGDCTEFGFEDELTSYVETVRANTKLKVYSASGNHDSRWSDSGKENFRRIVGPTYLSFDHNGVRFILMDSSMLLEQYAHFDGQQLARLEEELKSLPPNHPAIIAMHHPPLSPGKFFDNEYRFAELISRYNVPLVLTGHGHAFQRYTHNGTLFAMGGSTYGSHRDQNAYAVWQVRPRTMTRTLRRFLWDRSTLDVTIPTQRSSKIPRVRAVENTGFGGPLRFLIDAPAGYPPIQECTWKVDEILTGTATEDLIEVDPNQLPPGAHQLVAEIRIGEDQTDLIAVEFTTEKDGPSQPRISRSFPLLSGCQSHPAVKGNILYVAANDGFLRAIDLASSTGTLLWEANLNSEVVSAPAVTPRLVVIGSMDSHVYAFDRKTGEEKWRFKTGNAVFASPLIDSGTVYIGSGDRYMYAIDLHTGQEKWRFPAEAHIKATPALADGKLFFGAWDNWFYCVDAADGSLVWKVPVSVEPPRYSAATCNPVATDQGTIILCSHDYSVRCFDQKTGAQIWIYKPKKDELGPSYSQAVIKDGVAYFGSISGRVVGHRIATGQKVFDVELRPGKADPVFDSIPLIRGNRLYVGTVGGNLYCLNLKAKSVEWQVALQPGFIFTRPAWWKQRLLVGSMADQVFEVSTKARKR